MTFGNANVLSTTATFSLAGSYTLRLTASDSVLVSTDDVVVTVSATNQAPVVNAGADQTITLPATAALAGTASDDGLPTPPGTVTTSWSKLSGPGTVTFGNANVLSTTATFSLAGSYTLRLTASDSVLVSTDDVVVTVHPVGGPPPFTPIRINAGGPAFTDSLGQLWAADQLFTGGVTYANAAPIAGTTDDALYQTERYGNFAYHVSVPNGAYDVVLHFAELVWAGPGQRVMDVAVEGILALDNLDIVAQAGTLTSLVHTISGTVSDGMLDIVFTTLVDNAKLSALEIRPPSGGNQAPVVSAGADQTITLPAMAALAGTASDDGLPTPPGTVTTSWSKLSGPGTVTFGNANVLSTTATFSLAGSYTLRLTASDSVVARSDDLVVIVHPVGGPPPFTPIRINAGGPAFTDSLGQLWAADQLFTGGVTYANAAPIAGTTDDALYQTERYGDFAYHVSVPNGAYDVVLHFAELVWAGPGQRVMDVAVEGILALDNLDIVARTGTLTSLVHTISGTVSDGMLDIVFTTLVDNAKLSALEIRLTQHPGHPFLHVVIDAPPFLVDHDGSGSEIVALVGENSHTHQVGHQLVGWTWTSGTTVLGTSENISAALPLGSHPITLTIQDDNSPPETLSGSVVLPVYPLAAVGGLLARYYPTGDVPPGTLIDSLPALPGLSRCDQHLAC